MRFKLVILTVVPGLLALAVMHWSANRQASVPPPDGLTPALVTAPPPEKFPSAPPVKNASPEPVQPAGVPVKSPEPAAPVMTEAEHEEMVVRRAAELNALAAQPEPAKHQEILAELQNPDRAIRLAAVDALKQVNDTNVIPPMQQLADKTTDPAEKLALLEAIQFIQLPSLSQRYQKP